MLTLKTSFNTLDAVRQCSASVRFTPKCWVPQAEATAFMPRVSH